VVSSPGILSQIMEELLSSDQLPSSFKYPKPLLDLVRDNDIDIGPWRAKPASREFSFIAATIWSGWRMKCPRFIDVLTA